MILWVLNVAVVQWNKGWLLFNTWKWVVFLHDNTASAVEKRKIDSLEAETPSTWFVMRKMTIRGNMAMRTVAILLLGLYKLKLDVLIDPRTLLGTPRVNPDINLHKEIHILFSLEEFLQRVLENTVAPAHVTSKCKFTSIASPVSSTRRNNCGLFWVTL